MANAKKMVNGVVFELTDEEQATLNASHAEEQVRLDARAWLDGRLSEYPPLQDQLDMQYWDNINGTTLWADLITRVKTKHPKGE